MLYRYTLSDSVVILTTDETCVFLDQPTDPRTVAYQSWRASGNTPGPFVPPAPPGPQSVTPRQARLALLGAGLLDQVTAAVNAAGGAALITWDYATEFDRNDPLILAIGASLNMTSAQIDALFAKAATL